MGKQLHRSQAQKQQAYEQARDITKKLATAQAQFATAMREKEEAFAQTKLALEEKHHDQLANVLKDVQGAGIQGSPALTEASKETAQLFQRIDKLGHELSEQQRKFNLEKRRMASEAAAQLQEAAAEHRTKLQEEARKTQELEDVATELENQLSESRQNVLTWQQREEEAISRKEQLEATNDELRTEIRTLQQSFQATTSLDIAQGETTRDGESTIAALSAQSDARIRQLNNKVEFLKASLAAEQQRYAELEESLNTARRRLDESNKEIKRRNLVNEQKAREAVEEAEAKVRGQVDDALQEAAQLQARNAALQAQLGDALNDVAVAKVRHVRREEEEE